MDIIAILPDEYIKTLVEVRRVELKDDLQNFRKNPVAYRYLIAEKMVVDAILDSEIHLTTNKQKRNN